GSRRAGRTAATDRTGGRRCRPRVERLERRDLLTSITEFDPGHIVTPLNIVAGPDGALWFAEYGAAKVGRITTGGQLTEFPTPTPNSQPYSLAAGPDGALWFTENATSKIGRIVAGGPITEFNTPTPGGAPQGLAAGPD